MGRLTLFAVGGSAGGLDAVGNIVARLPADFPAALCVVLHMSADSPGLVPDILSAAGPLPARHPRDGETLEPGMIYVAPPNRHLILTEGCRATLGTGPKENLFRPAVDPLFRSAASVFGPRAAGVVLSGGLDDGAAGLAAIKSAGGVTLAQDPAEAQAPSMPRAAISGGAVDHVLPIEGIARCIVRLATPFEPRETVMSNELDAETQIAAGANPADFPIAGEPSMITCPDCGGVLMALGAPLRFRCHTGHAFGAQTLAATLKDRANMRCGPRSARGGSKCCLHKQRAITGPLRLRAFNAWQTPCAI